MRNFAATPRSRKLLLAAVIGLIVGVLTVLNGTSASASTKAAANTATATNVELYFGPLFDPNAPMSTSKTGLSRTVFDGKTWKSSPNGMYGRIGVVHGLVRTFLNKDNQQFVGGWISYADTTHQAYSSVQWDGKPIKNTMTSTVTQKINGKLVSHTITMTFQSAYVMVHDKRLQTPNPENCPAICGPMK